MSGPAVLRRLFPSFALMSPSLPVLGHRSISRDKAEVPHMTTQVVPTNHASRNQVSNPEREIARGVVWIYKEYFGRGPTWSQATIANTHVTVVLADALTVVERRLASEGNHETVRSLRQAVQQVMSDKMTELVEQATGRKVMCLLSDHHVPTDTAVEVLVFEREDGSGAATNGNGAEPSPLDAGQRSGDD